MAPIFTGPADVGVGVAVGMAVAVGVTVGAAVCVGVGVAVGATVSVVVGDRVGVSTCFPPPHAASTGTIKTMARARIMNLYHRLLFDHMVKHPLQRHR
jgi:hypothetical protein